MAGAFAPAFFARWFPKDCIIHPNFFSGSSQSRHGFLTSRHSAVFRDVLSAVFAEDKRDVSQMEREMRICKVRTYTSG